jgi:hypothetical protein
MELFVRGGVVSPGLELSGRNGVPLWHHPLRAYCQEVGFGPLCWRFALLQRAAAEMEAYRSSGIHACLAWLRTNPAGKIWGWGILPSFARTQYAFQQLHDQRWTSGHGAYSKKSGHPTPDSTLGVAEAYPQPCKVCTNHGQGLPDALCVGEQ